MVSLHGLHSDCLPVPSTDVKCRGERGEVTSYIYLQVSSILLQRKSNEYKLSPCMDTWSYTPLSTNSVNGFGRKCQVK